MRAWCWICSRGPKAEDPIGIVRTSCADVSQDSNYVLDSQESDHESGKLQGLRGFFIALRDD